MGGITTIDVSGGDISFGDFCGVNGQLSSVVGKSSDASESSCVFSVELNDLSGAHYRMLGVRWTLTVHANPLVSFLNDSVRLTCHYV